MKKSIICLTMTIALLLACMVPSVKSNASSVADTSTINGSSSSAVIVGSDVVVSASFSKTPSSDDGKLYLFELKTYQYGIPDGASPVATVNASTSVSATIPLNYTSGYSRLYNKFVYAVKKGGTWSLVSNAQYITNPEAVCATPKARQARPIKAFQEGNVATISLNGTGTENPYYNVLHGVFVVENRDSVCADATAKSADSHPVTSNTVTQYMLNANDDAGIEGLIADMVNYATYSDIQDYVIGNECNERCWNYMAYTDWDTYVRKYVQAFRVCYTAIKSVNPYANVYTSIDQVWDKNSNSYEYIDGKDFLVKFNNMINENGNIDWNLSIHPYPNPLYWPRFWDMSGVANGSTYTAQVKNDQVLTFLNLSACTNLMTSSSFLNRSGQVRDIIISEIGMGSNAGEEAQAAGLAAAWAAFERNPYVTQFMYLEYDVNGFFPTMKSKTKEVWNALGTADEEKYMTWAKQVIGISDWSEVLR